MASDIDREQQQERKMEANLQAIRKDIDGVQRNIRDSDAQKTDKLAAYTRNISAVVKDVDECERLRKWSGYKPVGPIGIHIKLNQKKYAHVIETILNKSMNAFVVQNQEDFRLLQGILRNRQW